MIDLRNYSTADLVEELCKRDGVKNGIEVYTASHDEPLGVHVMGDPHPYCRIDSGRILIVREPQP